MKTETTVKTEMQSAQSLDTSVEWAEAMDAMNTSVATAQAASIEVKPPTGRVIGITHRVKMRKDQEPRPTLVSILDFKSGQGAMPPFQSFELETEQDELDFLNGICPVKWRVCRLTEDVSGIPEHQIRFRLAKDEDTLALPHPSQCRYETKKGKKGAPDTFALMEIADKVPTQWIGIQHGDTLAMTLGGSGDYFAYALSRKLEEMGGAVIRIPPFKLKEHRGDASKDDDAQLLATLASGPHWNEFYETQTRDRKIISLRNAYQYWMDTMKARMACEQRLARRTIGDLFCTEAGKFPEGSLIKEAEARKATDKILVPLLAEENEALKKLETSVEDLDVWQGVFNEIPGVGPRIAARLINAIIDIRRFKTAPQLVKFLGVHVLADGRFPRRRNGELANWHPDGRQALYLLGDQFVRQSDKTEWGRYLIARKAALRVKHPVEVVKARTARRSTPKGTSIRWPFGGL